MRENESGNHLKEYRRKKELTLTELAELTGLSASYISKIERGVVIPSGDAVQKLCYALKITANDLMLAGRGQFPGQESFLVRPSDRSFLYGVGENLSFESVLEENPHFRVNVMTFRHRSEEQVRSVHSFDEFGIVARGTMEIVLGRDEAHILEEGDCLMIRRQVPHAARCLSEDGCVSYWIEIAEK